MTTLLDLLPPFEAGQRVQWTAALDPGFSHGRPFKITDVADLGDRWRVHATGPKRGQHITTTWAKTEPPRIELAP